MDSSELTSEEWSSLSGLYTAEEADFMAQLLGNFQVPENLYRNINLEIPSPSCHGHESTIVSLIGINSTSHFPQNADNSSSIADNTCNVFPTTSGGNCCFNNSVANFGYISMEDAKFSPYNVQGNDIQQINEKIDEEIGLEIIGDKNFQAHKECEVMVSEPMEEDATTNYLEKSGKRFRSSMEVLKNKRSVKSRKKQKSGFMSNTEEDSNPVLQEQSLSSEDDDSKSSLELNAGGSSSLSPKDSIAPKLRAKSRSNKSSATDPQSIYAKKRRERINEKLRILQNLVPNGTKVDISTMLEEAVQYVNFLQLQIKLLSSDDLWMYSPIAYNGMNIGLNLNIPPANGHRNLAHIKEDEAV